MSGADFTSNDLLDIEDAGQKCERSRNKSFKMFSDVRNRVEIVRRKSCDRYNLRGRNVEYLPKQLICKKNDVLLDASKFFTHNLAPRYVDMSLKTKDLKTRP